MISNKKILLGVILSLSFFINSCTGQLPTSISTKETKIDKNSFSTKNLEQTVDGYNETAYLWTYPDIRSAVNNGTFQSGYQHFIPYGKSEGRTKTSQYLKNLAAVIDEGFLPQTYLNVYPDINTAVNGNYDAAYEHFNPYGKSEGRTKTSQYLYAKYSLPFNEEIYLLAYPDINDAVNKNWFKSGYDHFLINGKNENREQRPEYEVARFSVRNEGYSEEAYLLSNLDVRKAVNEKIIYNGYRHYLDAGKSEGRLAAAKYIEAKQSILDGYNEEAYLMSYPDVYNVVKNGVFETGHQHYILAGKSEDRLNRQIYKDMKREIKVYGYNEDVYLGAYPDIKLAVSNGSMTNGLSHFISYGKQEGRDLRPEYVSIYTKMSSAPVAVTGLVKNNVTSTTATLNWNPSLGANRYDIYNDNNIIVHNVLGTTYQVSGVNVDTFNFKVYAANWRGKSAQAIPVVSSTFPLNNATRVSVVKKITVTFSENMDPSTITSSTFKVNRGVNPISGSVSYNVNNRTATFTPLSNLLSTTVYTPVLTTDVKNISGNQLASNFSWDFTTGQAPVFMGATLINFAALAGSTITSANATTINGDLGLSPGTSVTGFPPGILNGSLHAGNPTAATAKAELGNSYLEAEGRFGPPVLITGNVGGQTLNAGLYKSSTSIEISSGDLTLDGLGDPDAVFIFQIGSTFSMTSGRQIILSGGAQSKNIFWQVGSSATIGTGAVFKGNILSAISITMNSGSSVDGRLLAQSGAITFDANGIVRAAF